MKRALWFGIAACAVAAILILIFLAWRSSGLDILQMGMNIC